MTTIIYKIIDNEAYLTEFNEGRSDILEIHVDPAEKGVLHLGDKRIELAMGMGRVKLSTLPDGVITPEVVFNDRSVFLYPMRLLCGKVMLARPYEIYSDLGRRTLEAKTRVYNIEKELEKLKDAVYGKAIF